MSDKNIITKDQFVKRIGDLCLKSGLDGFPKGEADTHILLKSAVLVIGQADTLSEKDVNEKLKVWCQVTGSKGLDYGTMRRRLVDTGYLARSKDGSAYQVRPSGAGSYEFDPAVEAIDVAATLSAAREEIERRKKMYMEKARKA